MEALGKMILIIIAIITIVGFFMNPQKMKSEPLQQSMDTSKYIYDVIKEQTSGMRLQNATDSNITSQTVQE